MKRTTLVIVAVSAILLAGCGSPSSATVASPGETIETATGDPGTDQTTEPATDPTTEEPSGPVDLTPGQAATITGEEGVKAKITASSPTKAKCQYSFGCTKAKNGAVYQVVISLVNTGTKGFDINPFDFKWESNDGSQFDPSDGSSIEYQPDNAVHGVTVRKGGKFKGALVFDVPKSLKGAVLLYAPNFSGEPVAVWTMAG